MSKDRIISACKNAKEILEAGMCGEIPVTLISSILWEDEGDVGFMFGDMEINIFNDCDSVDYTNYFILDGYRYVFDDLWDLGCDPVDFAQGNLNEFLKTVR